MRFARFRTAALVVWLLAGLLRDEASAERPHTLYVEVLGKGGLWGVGYDHRIHERFGWGVAASFFVIDDQRISSLSPYFAVNLAGGGRHHWFVHLGPQIVHVEIPSPVPEWDGVSRTGIAAEVSTGYEYRDHLMLRVFGMATVGKGGFAPWLGVSIGWTL